MIEPKRRIGEGTYWILGFAAAVVVAVLIVSRYQLAIADVEHQDEQLRAAALPDAMYVHADPEFARIKGQLVAELSPLFRVRGAPSASVAVFLRYVQGEAARDNVIVDSIKGDDHANALAVTTPATAARPVAAPVRPPAVSPAGPAGALPARQASVPRSLQAGSSLDQAFLSLRYELTLRGSYRDILVAVSRIPTGPVLAKVEEIDLGPGAGIATDGRLVAHVKLTIYHAITGVENVGMISRGAP